MNGINTYFVKKTESGTFQDITTLYNGVRILKIDGFLAKGKPVNIYTAQWVNEQEEDFLIANTETINNVEVPVVIRENVDIEMTFIVKRKYASYNIDVQTVHDNFVDYMTGSDIYLKSAYFGNKYVHCVCLDEYKPTTVKLNRSNYDANSQTTIDNSYIIGTLKFHCLDTPKTPATA